MRVFLDKNVLVSAFATRGLCADLLRHVIAEHELLVGEVVLAELLRVLRTKFKLPAGQLDDIEAFLRTYEVVPAAKKASVVRVRDPDDALVLANAIEGKADVLVTGDPDLLVLGRRSPIRLMSPREFWTAASEG
ncbi:MAG: putative toxin-antitoxin system toxin component, PIN family [Planctomycetes bacterium]|nr:putative toxin-antitoxin system toxin component, PIN family [Planctomycetota bacterium]